jgi:hypothetical protein
MTIDERLEALTHSVELLAQMQLKTEKDLKRVGRYIGAIGQMVLHHEARLRAIEGEDEEPNTE